MKKKIDMERVKNVHLLGIGGCGMSAIAKILHQLGYKVSGSDAKESANTIRLRDLGVQVHIEHDASHVRQADVTIYSSAIKPDNPEMAEAAGRNIPILQRAEMLSWIMDRFKHKIAVAGTHGKTTTSSMISIILQSSGKDPSYLVGGDTDHVNGNARLGKSDFIVAEADESDGSFLRLNPNISVITNIEQDHMDYFESYEKLVKVFGEYVNKFRGAGWLALEAEHPNNRFIIEDPAIKKITYGLTKQAQVQALNPIFEDNTSSFEVQYFGRSLGEIKLSVPGEQNILNSLAALIVCLESGVSFSAIGSSLRSFTGAKRRFQLIGEFNRVKIFDDYAHHPTEVRMTLQAARLGWGPDRKIIAVFQPHRYTRTFHLAAEFGTAFKFADQVILTDIYSAGEKPIPNVDGHTLEQEVSKHHKNVKFIKRKERIVDYLKDMASPGDIVISMGAGDIHTICKELLAKLKMKHEAKTAKE